jgi:hypothetical protein
MALTILDRIRAQSTNGRRRQSDYADRDPTGHDSAPKVQPFTAADLMRMQLPEPRWAVEGIVPEGLTILAGKPKLGKSWLALNLALAVASGGLALGQIAVEAGDVLYLALEDTRRRLKNRLTRMLSAANAPAPARLYLQTAWPRFGDGGEDTLEDWLADHPAARLVVVDIFAKIRARRAGRGDLYDEDYLHGCTAKVIADRSNVALLMLFHCRKMGSEDPVDTVSGTLGMAGAADAVTVLTRERGKHDAALFITGRDIEERNIALKWDAAYGLWSIMGDADEYRLSQERRAVIQLFEREKRPLTPRQAAPLLGKKEPAVKKLLWEMAQAGQLRNDGSGRYTLSYGNPSNPGNPTLSGETTVTTVTTVTAQEREPGQEG